jgi:hypothetical protein
MSDIPVGKIITVWYIEETQKVGGGKVKVNTILLIDAVANAKTGRTYFKAFREPEPTVQPIRIFKS